MAAPAKPAAKSSGPKKGIWGLYKSGKSEHKSCPKCGDGHFMAKHKNRIYCGTCHYTEFVKQ